MELYLIRHTTPGIASGICYGQSDVALAEDYVREVDQVRAKLASVAVAACYSSPLQRCARLAERLGAGEPRHDERLQELHFGAWEMQPWDAIPRHELDLWGERYVDCAPPGGETFAALHRRAQGFLHDIAGRGHPGPVLAVTHAGVIRALLGEVLALPLQQTFRFHLDYGSITQLCLDGARPVVGYVNR